MSSTVTCNNCGWVHFQLSRDEAEKEVKKFNDYFYTLPDDKQQSYYGGHGSTIETYESCFRCGGSYKNFRPSIKEDCPDGCTIGPIINRDD